MLFTMKNNILKASLFIIAMAFSRMSYAEIVPGNTVMSPVSKEDFISSANTDRTMNLSISDCILMSLKNNSEIRIESFNPKIKEENINSAWAEFEPTFNVDYLMHDKTEKANNSLLGADVSTNREYILDAGVSGKLVTGTEYSLEFLNTRASSNSIYETINPSYIAEPKMTITQPVLRGFGIEINKADITIAKNNKQQSRQALTDTAIDVISRTKSAYYGYIYFREAYDINKRSLERAVKLFKINGERYKKGLLSSVVLLETEAAVLVRRKALISSERDLKKAEDLLKFVTNLVDDPKFWNASIKLTDYLDFKDQNIDLIGSLSAAFKNRPDYESKKIDLESRDIKIKVAKNALYPSVDLVGSFGLNGLGSDYSESLNSIEGDYKDWSVGVSLSLPWGGGERAEYNKTILEKAQGLMELKRLEQSIILEVRDRVREVDLAVEQVNASKLAKEAETKNFEAQKERYVAGQVSTHDLLDYEDKLSQSELDYIKSMVDYNVALVQLDKSQGLTLINNRIQLEG